MKNSKLKSGVLYKTVVPLYPIYCDKKFFLPSDSVFMFLSYSEKENYDCYKALCVDKIFDISFFEDTNYTIYFDIVS